MTRERLVQSIIDPSREITPQFTAYTILLQSGEVLTGIHVGDEVDGRMRFADQNGRAFYIHPNDVDRRVASSQSIMPTGLADNLTPQESRDVIAFLRHERGNSYFTMSSNSTSNTSTWFGPMGPPGVPRSP